MYRVLWVQSALNTLAAVWTEARDRNAVTAAVDEIDAALAANPEGQGESRDEDWRILHVPPLGVIFRVNRATRTVLVSDVWSFGKPRGGTDPEAPPSA